ncbi:uncharacterized protein LOC128291611 [Gossypium arboreum]|uniref:uncharacterized protein LOC128291611 n=1 Tax=Gossypium arboreum TaxID=29729 RepID=UPI0022F17D40|nr:uncharacterized protein LOC128291611 [Gossypium arboreum]
MLGWSRQSDRRHHPDKQYQTVKKRKKKGHVGARGGTSVASGRGGTGVCFWSDLTPHAEGFCYFVWGTIIYGPQASFSAKKKREEGKKEEGRREEEERKRRRGGEGGLRLREEKRKRKREGEEEEGRKKKERKRWSIYPGIGRSYTVPIYRLMIEQHAGEGFIWMPYRRPEIAAIIPSSAYVDSQLWCTNAPIISFNVVEWYHGDRVLRQFGCIQYIPDPPMQVGEEVHGKNKRGRHGQHWGVTHRRYIAVWESRMARRPQMDMSSNFIHR